MAASAPRRHQDGGIHHTESFRRGLIGDATHLWPLRLDGTGINEQRIRLGAFKMPLDPDIPLERAVEGSIVTIVSDSQLQLISE